MTSQSPAGAIVSTTIDIDGISIAALRCNPGAQHRVLAVHGWLDNANSFVPLAALLPDVDLVAIDLPGHGHSSHLAAGAHYHLVDIMNWVLAVSDALQWPQFHYLGHSLGGCIAPFVAVGSPHSVSSLMLLEADGPLTESADKIPQRLRRCIEDQRGLSRRSPRVFASIDEATDARLQATTMSRAAARLIVERQLQAVSGGYSWRYDPRHRSTSALYQTEEQVLAVLGAVSCPVLSIIADDGYLSNRPQTPARLARYEQLSRQTVPGHHHMHMDDPAASAEHILAFLRAQAALVA